MRLSNNPTAKNERRISALSRMEKKYEDGDVTKEDMPRHLAEMLTLQERVLPTELARMRRTKTHRGVR